MLRIENLEMRFFQWLVAIRHAHFFTLVMIIAAPISLLAQTMTPALDEILANRNLVGMAVGVSCGGEIQETYYGGFSHLPSQTDLTADRYFRVASISKSFTATAILQLYDDGLFELDDDISEALGYTVVNPGFPNTPITYRMLLSHTSSLQDGSGYSNFLGATLNQTPIPNMSEILLPSGAYFTPNMWRLESPGTFFAYSNINFGLLGTLIEVHSNVRFDQYMRTNVLIPLGSSGSFNIDDIPSIENVATLYRDAVAQLDNYNGVPPSPFNGSNYTPGTNGSRFGPQGGLRCTLEDLLAFGNMLLQNGSYNGNQILDSATVELMLAPEWTFNGSNGDNYFGLFRSWGLGIHRAMGGTNGDAVFAGIPMLGHPGEAYGLISDLYIHPESGLALAFLTNGYTSGGGYAFGQNSTFYRVEEEVFETIYDHWWESCAQITPVVNVNSAQAACKNIQFNSITGAIDPGVNGSRGVASLYNLQGMAIWKKPIDGTALIINESEGIYILEIADESRNCVLKIFKSTQ